MQITNLRLRDFRNYTEIALTPHPGVNLFFGQNGSGKTNLLEAVHYCALGRSHRTGQDREVVRKGAEAGSCGVNILRRDGRGEIAIRLMPDEGRKKQVFIDRKKAARLSELMGRVRCVSFSPEDLMLVREGPAVRRRFIDMMLSQLSPAYFIALQQYQKALDQRNALLRDAKKTDAPQDTLLELFEQGMADAAKLIIPMRRKFIEEIAALAQEKYRAISGRDQEIFRMEYRACLDGEEEIGERFAARLRQGRREDIFRATTGFGIHREDVGLTLSGREMKLFASQGQVRTAALAMKLAQLALYQQETGEPPILLLDDVMSELDMTRRTRLLEEISGVQTFVTCTDESDLAGCANMRTYRVWADEEGVAHVAETGRGEEIPEEEMEEPTFD